MAEETAEEAAQRVNTKRLAANREVRKESMPRNHKNSVKMGLRLKEKSPKNRAEESIEQRENRLAGQRVIRKKSGPSNHKNNVKTGLRLKEKLPKKSRRGIKRTT